MGHLLMSVPCGLGITCTRQPDERVRLRGADGKALQGDGTRQFWLKVGALKKQCEFYVTDVAKVILRVSSLCKSGTEAHINRQLLLGGYDEDCEPLVQHHGVCFVKIQTVIGATIKKRDVNGSVEGCDGSISRDAEERNGQHMCKMYVQLVAEDQVANETFRVQGESDSCTT